MQNAITRWLVAAALFTALVLTLASDAGSLVTAPGGTHRRVAAAETEPVAGQTPTADVSTAVATSGEAAIESLGSRLPAVARSYGWSAEEFADTLRSDSTLHLAADDKLFYIEPSIDSATASATALAEAAAPEATAPFPLADTFKLHSMPSAKLTILLDFDGETMSNNGWTAGTIVAPAWSIDGTANPGFNDTERAAIQDIWRQVAEDFAPFNVDVTTEFTSEAAITRTAASDLNYGTRVLVSPISSYFGSYGGIAYLGVFAMYTDYYKPALVFPEMLGNGSKNIAEAATHEAGHNLGLRHDGTVTPASEYYSGSGTGETGWAPIMGVGYYRNLTQWSKGEYPSATRKEDDLAIVKGYLGYRADDAGDATATATPLPLSMTVSASGLVGASTDVDIYRFAAGAGTTSITVSPAALGPNLDVYAEIQQADGTVVASSNPSTLLSASLSTSLSAGTYYLTVRGTGKLTPLDVGGYSNYASIGAYTVSGTVPGALPVTTATPESIGAFTDWSSSDVTISLVATEPVFGVAWTRYSSNGAPAEFYSGAPVAISTPGTSTFAYWSQSNSGLTEETQTVTVRVDKAMPLTTTPGLKAEYAPDGSSVISLVASDALSGVASTRWRLGTSGSYTDGSTVPVPSSSAVYTLQYYSTDVAGNVEDPQSTTFTVYDVTPPETTATVTPAAALTRWVSSDTTVTLTATDAYPGVAWTRYSLDRAAEQNYSAPIVIRKSGLATITFRSQDSSGNTETLQEVTLHVDKTAPLTTALDLASGYARNSGAKITLKATDAHSGVASTRWRLGTSGSYTDGSTVPVPSSSAVYTLQYYSTDVAGNVEDPQSTTFTVYDVTPPETTATVTPAAALTRWVSSDTTVTLTATDAYPGVAWTRYSLDRAAEQNYSAPIVIRKSGLATITFRSQDSSGNTETLQEVTLHVDKTAPLTTALDLASGYARNSGAKITLKATDAHSGVASTRWRLGTSGAFSSGSTVPVPSAVGSYTMQYFSADAVGNSESVRTVKFVVSPIPVTRVAGADRYETAVQLAREGWDPGGDEAWTGVKHILVANGEPGAEADPIGAAGLAGAYGAPVLLTQGSRVPGSTKAAILEIATANPGVRVHLIGGTAVVPDARWNDIKAIKGVSQIKDRVYGPNRYATSAAVARAIVSHRGKPQVQGVLIVAVDDSAAFFDALAASPIAYARTMPMIGVKKSKLEPSAMKVLSNELAGKPIYFVNSDAFVTRRVKVAIAGASSTTIATSSDRYTAATQIAQSAVSRGWLSRADIGLAAKLPDALTGGTYIGLRGGVLLFTSPSGALAPVTKSYIATHKAEVAHGWVIGGTAAVPAAQETSFRNLLQ